jgi:dienelactone hydrolase
MLIASGNPMTPWGGKRGFPSASSFNEHSRASQLTQAIDWAEKGAASGKYGQVDMSKVGVAGQSCGGVEAYSASVLDPRVKVTGIYNTGVIDPGRRHYLGQMKQKVGLWYGGKADFAHDFVCVQLTISNDEG